MGLFEDIIGIGIGNALQKQQQAQMRPWEAQGDSVYARMYAGLSGIGMPQSDYELALTDLDASYPTLDARSVSRYVEPLWLRFLRWLVRIL